MLGNPAVEASVLTYEIRLAGSFAGGGPATGDTSARGHMAAHCRTWCAILPSWKPAVGFGRR
jgi:hypothetical protein